MTDTLVVPRVDEDVVAEAVEEMDQMLGDESEWHANCDHCKRSMCGLKALPDFPSFDAPLGPMCKVCEPWGPTSVPKRPCRWCGRSDW